RDPGRLSTVAIATAGLPRRQDVPLALYRYWAQDTSLSIAAALPASRREVRTGDTEQSLTVQRVTPELFTLVGVEAHLGRLFSAPGSAILGSEAILSYQVWQRLFRG